MSVKQYILVLFFFVSVPCLKAQNKKNKAQAQQPVQQRRYTQAEVLDSLEGINMYNKYITALNGDSVRLNKDGIKIDGWQEDYYVSGKTLHKGFYKEGKLDLFRNFYENGKNERVMATIDPTRTNLDLYYDNGNQRKQINYYNGQIKKLAEFYINGLLKQTEEYDTDKKLLLTKKTWFESGQIASEMAVIDSKNLKYQKKTYHPNGKLYESGQVVYSPDKKQFFKTGVWTSLDEEGKNKKVEKHNGFKSVSN